MEKFDKKKSIFTYEDKYTYEYFVDVCETCPTGLFWVPIIYIFLICLGIGAFIYFPNPTLTNLIIAIIISILGLIVGIIWATKIWKTKGTMWFVSQVSATPDLDNLVDAEKETKQGSR